MKKLLFIAFVLGSVVQGWGQEYKGSEPYTEKNSTKFVYHGKDTTVIKAVALANKIINEPSLFTEIDKIPSFQHAEPALSGKELTKMMAAFTHEVHIDTYKSCWPWTSANAYTVEIKPTIIYLNQRKIKNDNYKTFAVSIIHEYVHLVDFNNEEHKFTHKGNKQKGNENSAPYAVEPIATKIIENLKL